ncbi:proline dehydrogenase family protein [Klebsiella pneumoniae]|nr:proline dehydrogenase family protein [Klebsiella pneumoniae]
MEGLEGYPVCTRKVAPDVSYLACQKKLLAVPGLIYPQFATATPILWRLSTSWQARTTTRASRFQCLPGMGEPLYERVVGRSLTAAEPSCGSAVGTHETLLAYLVRRLLENGANASFVNRIADNTLPLDGLVADPVSAVENCSAAGRRPACRIRNPAAARSTAAAGANSARSRSGEQAPSSSLSCAAQLGALHKWHALPMRQPVAEGEDAAGG